MKEENFYKAEQILKTTETLKNKLSDIRGALSERTEIKIIAARNGEKECTLAWDYGTAGEFDEELVKVITKTCIDFYEKKIAELTEEFEKL